MTAPRRPKHENQGVQREGGTLANQLSNWYEEQRSVYLYRACAAAETGTIRAELFLRLAGEAEAQSAIWRAQITARGSPPPPPFVADMRTRLVATLVRSQGPRRLQHVLAAMKVRGMTLYAGGARLDGGHAEPPSGSTIEHRHRNLGSGGNLRAAVFGVNDGLVSNASLILGVTGAAADTRTILMAGVAGLAAGAFAMAAGEYVSVRSQRERFEHQIALEPDELRQSPEAEAQELALMYAAKGLSQKEAQRLAKRLVADPEHALDTLAREERLLNPAELGAPFGAAASSFAAFGAGAALPLLPFVFIDGWALPVALGVTAVALFTIGAVLSLFTGRSAWFSGARMLALGTLAGGITFGIGRLFGGALG